MMVCMKLLARVHALAWLLLSVYPNAFAQAPARAPAPAASAPSSALNAELFYQVLVGELAARGSDPGAGFALLLDAARKTQDPELYQRAVQVLSLIHI